MTLILEDLKCIFSQVDSENCKGSIVLVKSKYPVCQSHYDFGWRLANR